MYRVFKKKLVLFWIERTLVTFFSKKVGMGRILATKKYTFLNKIEFSFALQKRNLISMKSLHTN